MILHLNRQGGSVSYQNNHYSGKFKVIMLEKHLFWESIFFYPPILKSSWSPFPTNILNGSLFIRNYSSLMNQHTHGHWLLGRAAHGVFVIHDGQSAGVHASSGYLEVIVVVGLVHYYVLHSTVLKEIIRNSCAQFLIN